MVEPVFWTRCNDDTHYAEDARGGFSHLPLDECHCGHVGWPQPCPSCDGSGRRPRWHVSPLVGESDETLVPCSNPECVGGVVWGPRKDTIEKAVLAAGGPSWTHPALYPPEAVARRVTEAVLSALGDSPR